VSDSQDWFVFRGKRDYLHSASLFDCIVARRLQDADNPEDIDFTFMRKSDRVCRIEDTNQGVSGLVAAYTDRHGQYFIYETDHPIQRRVHYAEPTEGNGYAISGDCASVQGPGEGVSFIELAVAAYKGLLTSMFPQNAGKYIFARIRLDVIPESSFEICYKRKVARHFFEGQINAKGSPIGFLYFGV
jgi:hypothetical protein